MTRAERVSHAVTALREARAATDSVSQPASTAVVSEPAAYACPDCGHRLRVSGLGRHRVYFELDDNRTDHPLMNRVCPECGHGLPGKDSR